jgi:hypothetical protein
MAGMCGGLLHVPPGHGENHRGSRQTDENVGDTTAFDEKEQQEAAGAEEPDGG